MYNWRPLVEEGVGTCFKTDNYRGNSQGMHMYDVVLKAVSSVRYEEASD